jgi:hypothetical protein
MRSELQQVIAICVVAVIVACSARDVPRNGPLAALADSSLRFARAKTKCMRLTADFPGPDETEVMCVERVRDTLVGVVSSAATGHVKRVVRTWGDTLAAHVGVDTVLANRLSAMYGPASPYDGTATGRRWRFKDGYVVLVETGRGNEQQVVFVSQPSSTNIGH